MTEGVGAMHISVSPPLPQVRYWYFRSSATLFYASLGDEGGEGVLTWLESDAAPLSYACGPYPQDPAAGTLGRGCDLYIRTYPCTHACTHMCIHVPHMHTCKHIGTLATSHPYWLESVTCPTQPQGLLGMKSASEKQTAPYHNSRPGVRVNSNADRACALEETPTSIPYQNP